MATSTYRPHQSPIFQASTSKCTAKSENNNQIFTVQTDLPEMVTDDDTCSSSPATRPPSHQQLAPNPHPPPPPLPPQQHYHHYQPPQYRRYNNNNNNNNNNNRRPTRYQPRHHNGGPPPLKHPYAHMPRNGQSMAPRIYQQDAPMLYPPRLPMMVQHQMLQPATLPIGPGGYILVPHSMNIAQITPPVVMNVPQMMSTAEFDALNDLSNNQRELFVHIQSKERLDVNFGCENLTIGGTNGPATILLVGEPIFPVGGLPIRVPAGHQVHQVLDETGCLRHIIMSLETEVPQTCENNLRTTRLPFKIAPPVKPVTASLPQRTEGASTSSGTRERSTDSNENENISELLGRVLLPMISSVRQESALVYWNPIDTSEAAASGGHFPQIDSSEFTYAVVLSDAHTRRILREYNVNSGNSIDIHELRPASEYVVQIKGVLAERKIVGPLSAPQYFKTLPGAPGRPTKVRVSDVGASSIKLSWTPGPDNGSPLLNYSVYVFKLGEDLATFTFQLGLRNEAKISELVPGINYAFKIVASNLFGSSPDDVVVSACTRGGVSNQPPPPPVPTLLGYRHIQLSWIVMTGYIYYLELTDEKNNKVLAILDNIEFSTIEVQNLRPDTVYKFRICTQNSLGEIMRSEWTPMKTTNSESKNNIVPTTKEPQSFKEKMQMHILNTQLHSPDHQKKMVVGVQEFKVVPANWPPVRRKEDSPTSSTASDRRKPRRFVKTKDLDLPPMAPTKPIAQCMERGRLQIRWNCISAKERETKYVIEGAQISSPNRFRQLDQVTTQYYNILADDIQFIRVRSVSKTGISSAFSEPLELIMEDGKISLVKKLAAPVVTATGPNRATAKWNKLPYVKDVHYELRKQEDHHNFTILYLGKETQFNLTGLEPNSPITLQVRAIVQFEKEYKVFGEWSEAGTTRTLHACPPSPSALQYDNQTRQLRWECAKADVTFKLFIAPMHDSRNVSTVMTKEKVMVLNMLDTNHTYLCNMVAVSNGEESLPSEMLRIDMPANVPAQPEAASAVAVDVDTLLIRWTHGDCGGKPIRHYRLTVFDEDMVIRQDVVRHNDSVATQEHRLQGLDADKLFSIEIRADNEVGIGHPVVIAAKTKSTPLLPAKIRCDPEATMLKLHWNEDKQDPAGYSYRIQILQKNGSRTTVYEGKGYSTKVKNLQPDTEYAFQIRTFSRVGEIEAWSEPQLFRTCMAPLPFIREALSTSILPDDQTIYRITWKDVIAKNANDIYYRLQIVVDQGNWQTIYNGRETLFQLKRTEYKGPIQVRVFCVRDQSLSQPSPVAYLANEPIVVVIQEPPKKKEDGFFGKLFKQHCVPLITFFIVGFIGFIIFILAKLVFPAVDVENSLYIPATTITPTQAVQKEL